MKGMMECLLLAAMEKETGVPIYEYFDLIAGTSIGGILAILIAVRMSATEALQFFYQDGPRIFKKIEPEILYPFEGPRYTAEAIESVLQARLGSHRFYHEAGIKVIIPSIDMAAYEPVLFRSWVPSQWLAWQVARATSAAQSYFPGYPARDTQNNMDRLFWDGGSAENNPAYLAAGEAACLWPGEKIAILSLGCGGGKAPFPAKELEKPGIVKVAITTLSLGMDCTVKLPDMMLRQLAATSNGPGGDGRLTYTRIEPSVLLPMDEATPSALKALELGGYQMIEENADRRREYYKQAA